MEKLKIIRHGVFQNLRSAFQDAIQMASANVCWQSGTEFLLEVSTYCQLKVCKKSYIKIKTFFSKLRVYWDLRLSELFIFQKSITLTDEELVWRDFLVWLDQTIAMSCSMVIGEISRGSILSESSKNVMGSSFDPRSHMRLHLLRFQICSFWHAITLGSSLCGQPEELLCNWNY